MLDRHGRALQADLQDLFARDADHPLDDEAFDRYARRVLRYTLDHVPAYTAYCRARGISPEDPPHWGSVPGVPTAAFKELTLLAEGASAEAVFLTSGTTRGSQRRGAHHVASLGLYRASLRPTFSAFLLPDGARLPFLSLMPAWDQLPDSSLAFMVSDVMEAFGAEGSQVLADGTGLDVRRLNDACQEAIRGGQPVVLLGTSAAFIHWLDALDRPLRLPDGSRLMDTGGFKGRGRQFEPPELRALYQERLGVPEHRCVNEYGMTELLSQRYDDVQRAPGGGTGGDVPPGTSDRWKAGPPWLRSVAVDPETLSPLPDGEPGILRHFDLANLGSVPCVQTEDYGRVMNGRVLLEGRATGAPPRGCSIAMDLLLQARAGEAARG
ncbi:MAG TPA: hypothetical protein VK966_06420 [Longimicrobiales bacterium]|nr:hypothetical protein [Longimicrobiales bacterium]